MKAILIAALWVAIPALATPIEATCQREANEQRMTGQARATYLQQCRREQGMPAAIALCERSMAKWKAESYQKQHAMQLCFLEYLHPGNGPFTPPGRIPEKNYKAQ